MEVDKAINEIERDMLESIHKSMDKKGAKSLKKDIIVKKSNNGFAILATNAVIFADKGRKPGKMPSVKSLKPWAKKHGIPLKALYPIAKSIGKDGTKGKHFLGVIDKHIDKATDKIGDAFEQDLVNKIKDTKI